MMKNKLFSLLPISVFFLTLVACSKYAKKVEGTYIGTLTQNDSILSMNEEINISEIANKRIKVMSNFSIYELDIEKERYFATKYYYAVNPNEYLEITNSGELYLMHSDSLGISYFFSGVKSD